MYTFVHERNIRNPYITMSGKYCHSFAADVDDPSAHARESISRLHSCGSDSNEQRVLGKIIQSTATDISYSRPNSRATHPPHLNCCRV